MADIRVGFDIRPLIFTKAGIKTYLFNLISALAGTGACDLDLFVSSASRIDWRAVSGNINEKVLRFPHINDMFGSFWEEYILPSAVNRSKCGVFHGARFFAPARLSCPSVVTVHDLAFKKIPDLVTAKSARYFDSTVLRSVKTANRIIVPSEATGRDLQDLYGADPVKIAVVHEAADPRILSPSDPGKFDALKKKLGIRSGFILTVGTIEPRKNYKTLIKAYSMLKLRPDIQLVVAGGTGWLYDDVFMAVKDLHLENNVIFAGYLDTPDLAQLYRNCDIFVMPSLYEGFGLPVLEALNCGACVVASDTSSIKEIFGGCFYPVDPDSAGSIVDGMEKVLQDDKLRADLKSRGKVRAADFSWQKAAKETISVYSAALGKGS